MELAKPLNLKPEYFMSSVPAARRFSVASFRQRKGSNLGKVNRRHFHQDKYLLRQGANHRNDQGGV